ncbi:hypothetical protein ACVIHH_003008 [Bradyrhizobium sp. USDA 4518]
MRDMTRGARGTAPRWEKRAHTECGKFRVHRRRPIGQDFIEINKGSIGLRSIFRDEKLMLKSKASPRATSNAGVVRCRGAIGMLVLVGLVAASSAASAQAQRLSADLACRPTEQALTFLCTVRATSDGAAIDGAQITLTADMPSMPMAHNVSPVKAQPVPGQPGKYEGRMRLGMLGEWAVKIRFESPRQDVVVRKLVFEKDNVSAGGTH